MLADRNLVLTAIAGLGGSWVCTGHHLGQRPHDQGARHLAYDDRCGHRMPAVLILGPLLGAAAYGWTPLLMAVVPRLVPSALGAVAMFGVRERRPGRSGADVVGAR